MAKKTIKQIQQDSKSLFQLRWEYARKNESLIAEYDNLIQIANKVLAIPHNEIYLDETGKALIKLIQDYVNKWQYHPFDPRQSVRTYYYNDPVKQLVINLSNDLLSNNIPGIQGSYIKAVKSLTKLPMTQHDIGAKKSDSINMATKRLLAFMNGKKGKITNVFGEMPDKILVEVNLLSSKSLIDLEFEEIIDKCFEILKFQGRLPAVKPRSLELERNLEVYDYFKKTASIKKTADKFFKSDDEESSISRTKKVIKRTEQLINKGYMELI